jgi:hypothetical protein
MRTKTAGPLAIAEVVFVISVVLRVHAVASKDGIVILGSVLGWVAALMCPIIPVVWHWSLPRKQLLLLMVRLAVTYALHEM